MERENKRIYESIRNAISIKKGSFYINEDLGSNLYKFNINKIKNGGEIKTIENEIFSMVLEATKKIKNLDIVRINFIKLKKSFLVFEIVFYYEKYKHTMEVEYSV